MPNLFGDVQFAKYTPTYVGAPIEQFAKTADILNQRYEQNKDLKDQLDIAMTNVKLEDADNPILKARVAKIKDSFAGTLERGDFENAGSTIKTAFKEFAMDGALKAAQENYAVRQQTKEELKQRYDKGMLSATQYQDRVNKFNQYGGVGAPDELGFYNKYQFDFGVKRVDLNELADKASTGFKADITSRSGESIGYANDAYQAAGIANSSTTSSVSVADGRNVGTVIGLSLTHNPDAMAYIQDEVRIHNENNPDAPITVQKYIDDFSRSYIENETYSQTSSDSRVLRDEDEMRRAAYKARKTAEEEGLSGSESLYTENGYEVASLKNMRTFAEEQLNNINNPSTSGTYSAGGYNTGFATLRTRQSVLTKQESEEFNNIKAKVPGTTDKEKTINALTYLKNIQANAKNIQYSRYDGKPQIDRTKTIYNNRTSRNFYDIATGKELKPEEKESIEAKDFEVLGKPEFDNDLYDKTNNMSYAIGDVVLIKGKKYIAGASVDELNSNIGKLGQQVNTFTSSRRFGKTINLFGTQIDYIPQTPEYGNQPTYRIVLPNKQVAFVPTVDENNNPLTTNQIYSSYINTIQPK